MTIPLLQRLAACLLIFIGVQVQGATIQLLESGSQIQSAGYGQPRVLATNVSETNLTVFYTTSFGSGSNVVRTDWLFQQTSAFGLTATGLLARVTTDVHATNLTSGSPSAQDLSGYFQVGIYFVFSVDEPADFRVSGNLSYAALEDETSYDLWWASLTNREIQVGATIPPGVYGFYSEFEMPSDAFVQQTWSGETTFLITPGSTNVVPPAVTISLEGTNVVLKWPTNSVYKLQRASELTISGNAQWLDLPRQSPLPWPRTNQAAYFRLIRR